VASVVAVSRLRMLAIYLLPISLSEV